MRDQTAVIIFLILRLLPIFSVRPLVRGHFKTVAMLSDIHTTHDRVFFLRLPVRHLLICSPRWNNYLCEKIKHIKTVYWIILEASNSENFQWPFLQIFGRKGGRPRPFLAVVLGKPFRR